MAALKLSLLLAIYLVCAVAQQPKLENYAGGPLPNHRLKKNGVNLKNVAMRLVSSPGPCSVCCSQQRAFERACRALDEEEEELQAAVDALNAALADLGTKRDRIAEIQTEKLDLKRQIANLRNMIADINGDLLDGGDTMAQRVNLRAQKEALSNQAMAARDQLTALRTEKRALKVEIEDAAANIAFLRQDITDERNQRDRAEAARDRAKDRLDRCLARQP